MKTPNEKPRNLEITDSDKFLYEGVILKFIRKDGEVTGLQLDAGRVKNLEFIKETSKAIGK